MQQPKEIKLFSGMMDTDSPNEVVGPHSHINARNITFRGSGLNMRPQNVRGNTLIPNSALPAGTNVTVGSFYDSVKGRLFFANYNSNLKHGWYIYYTALNTIQTLVQSGTGTNGDVLNFDVTKLIIGVGIIYGDSQQGDILYYLNAQRKPCKININRALTGGYGTIQSSYFDVAKAPPSIPPVGAYENDATVTVNNMRKKLFVFMYRFWYDDNDKSTWSEHSELQLPLNPFDKTIDADPTKNADIALVVQTGRPNVKKVEIAAAVSQGNLFGQFFSIAVLDKASLNIPDDDIYLFRFYNDKQYNYVDTNENPLLDESILLYDLVPLAAQAMEVLNGDTLIYGNITEGYPNITQFSNGINTTNVTPGKENVNRTSKFYLFVVTQHGDTANGSGSIHFIVAGTITNGDVFNADFGGTIVTYTASAGQAPSDVINGLAANAVSAGFTVLSSDFNNLYITKANAVLDRYNSVQSANLNTDNSSYPAYDWWSNEDYGLVYYDDNLKTPGVQTDAQMTAESNKYEEVGGVLQLPKFTLNIYHRPPLWAKSFNIVRTKNLSKSKITQWISDRTFKDAQSSSTDVLFAYVSIENLNTFVANNPSSPLTYQFSVNDRIRFIKLFNTSLGNPIYDNQDFEVQGQVINPVINGVQQTGQFLKIVLPQTTGTFDFGVVSSVNFNNYFIEIYSPAQPVANGLDVYYEIGERYAIINPGSGTQSHQGETQNQSSDLSTPATVVLTKGDFYYRKRSINTGIEMVFQITPGFGDDSNAGRITLGCTLQSASYNDANIVTGSSPYNNLVGFNVTTDNSRWIIRVITGTYLFRIKGTLSITFTDDRSDDQYTFFLQKNTTAAYTLVPPFDSSKAGTYTFTIDRYFDMESGDKLFIFGYSIPGFDHTRTMAETNLTITSQQFFTQGMIDPNFSDFYASAVNSNGRQLIVDPNANQVTYPTLMRWGQAYLVDTNINKSNRFYTTTFDSIDRGRGSIQKFKVRDRILRIFQERGCAQAGVYTKFIQDSGGNRILTTTDDIITSNNVQYYEGEYGCGLRPESLVHGKIQDYFADYIRGYFLRLSGDGIIPISELYKGQYTIKGFITQYNKTWTRTDGGNASIIGCYDYFEEQYMPVLQGGVGLGFHTLSFNEPRNAFSSFFDLNPEWIASAEDKMYSFLHGDIYVHNDQSPTANFFGVQYESSITVVFNDRMDISKTFNNTSHQGNRIWTSATGGDILTSMVNAQTGLSQISQLKDVDYEIQKNIRTAAFLRDINSNIDPIYAVNNGDFLDGQWIQMKFAVTSPNLSWIYMPTVYYQLEPKN